MLTIPLSTISEEGIKIQQALTAADIEWDDQFYTLAMPIVLSCMLKVVTDGYRIDGTLQTTVQAACDRCLEATALTVDAAFDYAFNKNEPDGSPEDYDPLVHEAITSGEIALINLIKEQIYLTIPMQILCRPNCLGLCPHCGSNRNSASCTCVPQVVDPRLTVLKKWQTP